MTDEMNAQPGQYSLSQEDEEKVLRSILDEILLRPPTIGLVGASGTGKSSTINAMFKTDLPVSHVVACTKKFRDSDLQVSVQRGTAAGHEAVLRVVDAPGLGEDLALDAGYLAMYREHLTRCDVIIWVMTARNRAVALDQYYLTQLLEFSDKMVFGINQVDLVEPINWAHKINLPSLEQEKNILTILQDRRAKIEAVVKRPITMIPYSAKHKWQLQELFTAVVESAPRTRAWIFSALKAFKHDDFLPEAARKKIAQMLDEQQEPQTTKRPGWSQKLRR